MKIDHSLNINKLGDYKLLGLCLTIGFLIRLIPEVLAYSTPIGFDTIYYANVMKTGIILPHWSSFFTSTWLLSALTVPIYNVIQGDPFLILKIIAPILFGLNVAGVYWFSRKMLNWSPRMSLLAGIFFALQLASLRISWDLLRNTLGLGILLFALSYVKEVNSKRGFALFTGFSLFAVFAHEYAAVILLATVGGLLAWKLVKNQLNGSYKMLALGLVPSLAIFLVGVYLRINPIRYGAPSNVIDVSDVSGTSGLFFLTNYLRVQTSVDYYANYWMLALNVALLFTVLFVPYVYLVKKGYFENDILTAWTALLLVGALGCLIMPFFAFEYWHRWMFMLVYPFTFYAVYGIAKAARASQVNGKISLSSFFSNRKASGMVILTFCLGATYLLTPLTMTYLNKSVPNMTGTQTYFSTDPAVPYQDEQNVVLAMNWINENANDNSCVILKHNFLQYGNLYISRTYEIVHYEIDVNQAINTVNQSGKTVVYFVWWNTPVDWNEGPAPDGFVGVADFGRISVYSYMKA